MQNHLAMDKGKLIMAKFAAENVKLGITQLGLTTHVRTVLREVKECLDTGSLYDSIIEISKLDSTDFDATILTPARLLYFRNQMELYLSVPQAEAWNDAPTWL